MNDKKLCLTVYHRVNLGKRNNKKLYTENKIPAIIYNKTLNYTVYIHKKELDTIINKIPTNNILECIFNDEKFPIIIKEIKKHPLKLNITHIDLQKIQITDIIKSKIPIIFTGEKKSPGIISGGSLIRHLKTITIQSKVEYMPENISIDISKLNVGENIFLKDINFSNNIKIPLLNKKENLNILIVNISGARVITTENK